MDKSGLKENIVARGQINQDNSYKFMFSVSI